MNANPTDAVAVDKGAFRMDKRLRVSLVSMTATGGAFALAAFALFRPAIGISVVIGALIAIANLYVLARIVFALLPQTAAGARASSAKGWGLIAMLKLLVLFAGIYILMTKGLVVPLAMLVGFGALPIGIAIGSMVSDRTAREEDPANPASP